MLCLPSTNIHIDKRNVLDRRGACVYVCKCVSAKFVRHISIILNTQEKKEPTEILFRSRRVGPNTCYCRRLRCRRRRRCRCRIFPSSIISRIKSPSLYLIPSYSLSAPISFSFSLSRYLYFYLCVAHIVSLVKIVGCKVMFVRKVHISNITIMTTREFFCFIIAR